MASPSFLAPAVGGPQDEAVIRRLATAAGIEDGPVEDDERCVGVVYSHHASLDGAQVGIAKADRVGSHVGHGWMSKDPFMSA